MLRCEPRLHILDTIENGLGFEFADLLNQKQAARCLRHLNDILGVPID